MQIRLAYGKSGLDVTLPDTLDITVIEPRFVLGIQDPSEALTRALREPMAAPPLRERVKPADRVGIVFSDITRATPHGLILPAILAELSHLPQENITLFCALGTHRENTESELRRMFAMGGNDDIAERLLTGYRIVQNNSFEPATQVCIGTTSRGHDIWLNREVAACDVKILSGFIEPHFFAGFSGGGKALMPGMAGQRTVLGNHDAAMIANPNATWGVTQGNPIYEEVMEVASAAGGVFLVNVALNKNQELTAVFAGDLATAHAAGCKFVKHTAMAAVDQPFDVVVTSNSGYPLDLNLYQAVKGMSAAAQIVRQGGAIVCVAECWDGIPDHGLYGQLLRDAESPAKLLAQILTPGFLAQDQWQAQIQAQIQLRAEVYLFAGYLSDEQIRACLLEPSRDVAATVQTLAHRYGPRARICILPEGPQTIPYVAEAA